MQNKQTIAREAHRLALSSRNEVTTMLRQKKKYIYIYVCVCVCLFQVSRPYQGFGPDPKHFIVNCEQNVVKFAGKWGKMY